MAAVQPLVVGVIFPAKKIERLEALLGQEEHGVRFVMINLEAAAPTGTSVSASDIEAAAQRLAARYKPLDAILHKLAHDMVFAGQGDKEAATRVKLVQEFERQNPSVRVMDPLDSVRLLTCRYAACQMLRTMETVTEPSPSCFKVPFFHVVQNSEHFQNLLTELDAGRTRLPLICKSVEACATERSHMMSVITKREDLVYVEYPVLYQEFVNHSGRLYKGYVLGDTIKVAERRSLPNLVAGDAQQVHFNTQEDYPTSGDFHSHDVDDSTLQVTTASSEPTQEKIFAAVRLIGERLRDELKLTLFGFDVIVADDGSRDLYVIDVNYFPSYRELDDLSIVLRKHLKQLCGRQ
uniref:Inositol-tetrakisphosphate 1-kinase n=1 Tax=Peronospora matthiolae TaxID=2874970 RepID=A0AAV1TE71_9STRA